MVLLEEGSPFLRQQQQCIDEYRKSQEQGIYTLLMNTQPPAGCWGRIWYRLYPPLNLGNPSVMKICKLWGTCAASLVHQNGIELRKGLNEILIERKLHPKEFQAILPQMNKESVDRVVCFMRAYAYLFLLFDSAHKSNPEKMRLYIDKAVEWYHKAGISKDEPSLINYRKAVIEHAEVLEEFQAEMNKSHTINKLTG